MDSSEKSSRRAKRQGREAAVLRQALERAGLDMETKLSDLELTFMCPQELEELALFPDTIGPRAIALMPIELPLTLVNGRASGTVSRHPVRCLTIDSTSGSVVRGPTFANLAAFGHNPNWTATPASTPGNTYFLGNVEATAGSMAVSVSLGEWTSDGTGAVVGTDSYNIPSVISGGAGDNVDGLPASVSSTLGLTYVTSDTTPARFAFFGTFVVSNGGVNSLVTVTAAAVAGSGTQAIANITPPANTVALNTYGVANVLASPITTTVRPTLSAALTGSAADLTYPVGGGNSFASLTAISNRARITGLAVHLRNDSPEITAQGEVVLYQRRDDTEVMPVRTVENLGSLPGRYEGKLAEGAYGFMLPWSTEETQSPISIPWVNLVDGQDDVLPVDSIDFAVRVDPTATNQQLVLVVYPVVEYKSINPHISVRHGKMDILAIQTLMNVFTSVPHLMSNDSHWSKIKSVLGRGLSALWNTTKPFIKDVVLPTAGKAILAAL